MTTEERLARLERQNRLLKGGLRLLLLIVVIGGLLIVAQQYRVPDVVTAKAFQVVGHDGTILVKLEDTFGTGRGVAGTITTQNSNGQDIVELGVNIDGGGAVTTLNSQGQGLVLITTNMNGGGGITTLNGEGQQLVTLGTTIDGEGLVGAFDPNGRQETEYLTTRP